MGYFVAFPAYLLAELLALLPDDARPVYAERFEPIVSDLVWIRDDAENAVIAALQEQADPRTAHWIEDQNVLQELVGALMEEENTPLVSLAQEALCAAAREIVRNRLARTTATDAGQA